MPVIRVENVGKKYTIGQNGSGSDGLRHAIHDFFTAPVRALRQNGRPSSVVGPRSSVSGPRSSVVGHSEEFWALKDVSFEVKQGEVVGIIGRNGAGKSTLLKILSRITEPTTGRLGIRGRVASLLEVGTGFHPELTGRENVFLNGAILGMTREEIKRKFDEIVAFAEIEKFIDTPVKRYSSGMYVRLAFAVAAHLEPEILIIDEVLSVGDDQFQKKCLGKMGSVAAEGRTVLFVSHNMNAIIGLCSRGIWLQSGTLMRTGEPNQIVSLYLSQSFDFEETVHFSGSGKHDGEEATILSGTIHPQTLDLNNGMELDVRFKVRFKKDCECNFILYVYREGSLAFFSSDFHEPVSNTAFRAGNEFEIAFEVPKYVLNPGYHSFGFAVVDKGGNCKQIATAQQVLARKIADDQYRRGNSYLLGWNGAVSPILSITGRVTSG